MHSSRMRTVRSLTAPSSTHAWGGVCVLGGMHAWGGMHAQRGVHAQGGGACVPWGHACQQHACQGCAYLGGMHVTHTPCEQNE